MHGVTRRSLIHGTAGLGLAAGLARPHIARAAATTATVWWPQGFVQEEDVALRNLIEDYQKASGNTIDYSIVPFAPLRQKIVSAITSGAVPDLVTNTPTEAYVLFAWNDKLLEVSDIIATQKDKYSETALLSATCYNSVEKRRGFYGVPFTNAASPHHIWRSLVEKAGAKIEDIPKTFDAFYDFFKDVQKKLRARGERRVYGLGLQVTTNGNDPNALFNHFLLAYGGEGIVSKDGRLHLDDPQVRDAAIKALTYPVIAYKEGFVPPGAINWNDADDNTAFHAKQIVMDYDGTISTEVAIIHDRQDYDDVVTMGNPLSNDGRPVPAQVVNAVAMIPKGAKNPDVAADFMKYFIQPNVLNQLLKTGLGRSIPPMPSIVQNDQWWFDDLHRKAYVELGLLGPSIPEFYCYNPAYAQVRNEHVWATGWTDIMQGGLTPQAAADKAFKRVEEIFAKYPIMQS
jgi:multiple sugar transport system substrate-binding protein